jgi:hypothetical protein
MRVFAFGIAALAAVVLAAGCSSAPDKSGVVSSQSQPIQGGLVDSTHTYAVGVFTTTGLICSGALIAPNLVLTARHCVNQPSSTQVTCSTTTFGGQYTATSNFYVTTATTISYNNATGRHQAKQIFTTTGSTMCGNDMAMIMLTDNVSLSEAGGTYVTPVVQYSMTDHTRYSTTITAIGFGDTSATTMDAGERHIIENTELACIPGDAMIDCPSSIIPSQMSVNEFQSGDGTCEGDSGSSAYEQKNFNKNIPVTFGVLSRGGSMNSMCIGGVYTRTDSFKDFIVNTALTAATAGGYTAPSWTQPPPPADAGAPPPVDSGVDAAAPPPPGTLGAPCGDDSDCTSGICLSNDGGSTYICSATCDPNGDGSDCGDPNFQCVAAEGTGYCFPKPPTMPGDAENDMTLTSGGCAVGRSDPSKPVPWGTIVLGGALFAGALARSRRRR